MEDREGEEVVGQESSDWQSVHNTMLETAAAIREQFGDREPSDEEVHAFLRERLLAEGKSPEEVDTILRDLL